MKDLGVIILILGGAWLFMSGKLSGVLGGKTMTPTTPTSPQLGTQPQSEPQQGPRELISEVPPPDVELHYIGTVQYAKFTTPIDVGDGFKQWGVTTQGYPVLSTKPPEEYSFSEWMGR